MVVGLLVGHDNEQSSDDTTTNLTISRRLDINGGKDLG